MTASETTPVRRGDRGSVLMLMPAAVVIVLLLGAIAVDAAIVYLDQRQAYNVAFDAANDAAGAAFDAASIRDRGRIVYDRDRLRSVAERAVDGAGVDGLRLVTVASDAQGRVVVTVEYRTEHLFGPAFGTRRSDTLRISASAEGAVTTP